MPNGTLTAGLSYFHPTSLRAQGMLIQGADSLSSDMYNYRYKIQSQQLLAEGKWYWTRQKYFQPFITLGIGLAFNKVSDYQTSVPSFYAFTPYFPSHTQTNFTYALSTGFDLSLNQSVRLGMGYRFTDLGTVRTGEAQINNLPTNSTLRQSNLYANQIFAQITFIPSIN
ncbi:hypothetical protein ELY15_09350 [Legionella sp. km772]|nr:hypothetical protein ELY15_09350 [Legionella sp. km772]